MNRAGIVHIFGARRKLQSRKERPASLQPSLEIGSPTRARTRHLLIRNPLVDSLPGLTAAFENAPPSHRRSSWPRHAHQASLSSRTVGFSLTRDTSASVSACVLAPSLRNRLKNDFASRWRGSSTSGNARHTHIRPSPTAPHATWLNRVLSAASTRSSGTSSCLRATSETSSRSRFTTHRSSKTALARARVRRRINRTLEVVRTILNCAARTARRAGQVS